METKARKTKIWYRSKINLASIILILTALQPLIAQQNFEAMRVSDWLDFAIGVLIIIFRTYYTKKQVYVRKKRV